MIAYLVRRVLQCVITLFGVALLVFVLLHLLPGGPARGLLGPKASAQQVALFLRQQGYDAPVYVQFGRYLGRLFEGNLGYSYHYNQSVVSLLAQNLPKTALLVGASIVVALLIAIPVGMAQAVKRNQAVDYVLTGFAFLGYAMPTFWVGILFVVLFSVTFHVFPSEAPQTSSLVVILEQPRALVLPVLSLTVVTVAQFSRFVRASAIDVLVQDYVRTARAIGSSSTQTIRRHVLRNSLGSTITLIGVSLPFLVSGAVVVESVFNYPGMGLLFWTSAVDHDYPVLLGFTLVVGVATVLGSLLADVLYAVADPRIRYS